MENGSSERLGRRQFSLGALLLVLTGASVVFGVASWGHRLGAVLGGILLGGFCLGGWFSIIGAVDWVSQRPTTRPLLVLALTFLGVTVAALAAFWALLLFQAVA
ncbi:MAG: hypothetical protein JXB62_13225 [Pirellulales bacterium]|nr:hypothetical protein [Pirellulales bacterium]